MATRINDLKVRINGGPNRWSLIIESLINGKEVEFSVVFPARYPSQRFFYTMNARILGLYHKTDSEYPLPLDDWFISGRCNADFKEVIQKNLRLCDSAICEFELSFPEEFPFFFTGIYNTQNRYGEIQFILPNVSNATAIILPDYISKALQS